MKALHLAIAIAVGVTIGCVLGTAVNSAVNWYAGGSGDPRCMYGLAGYVEIHFVDNKGDVIGCEYRPDIARRAR